MPNAPRIFKRLSELLDVTGETGVVYVTGGTASFLSTTGSGDIVLSASPQFTGTAIFADAQVNGSLAVVGGITAATVAATFTGDGSGLSFLNAGSITSGTLAVARGGTGVSNAGTLTNASNTTITGGGTLALGGFTLTVPATGTVALLTATQTLTNKTLTSPTLTAPVLGAATATSLVCATDGGGNIGNSGSNRFANIYATNQLKSFGSIENGVFGYYGVGGCTQIQSNAQGVLLLLDFNTGSTFSRIQFGGTTTSFPAIKRNATAINIRLADDSADAPLTASNITASGTLSVTGTSTFTGLLTANGGATVAGGIGVGAAVASTTFAAIAAATTAKSAINLASGTAPTSPNNGDIWFDGTDLKMRIGGVTKTFTLI